MFNHILKPILILVLLVTAGQKLKAETINVEPGEGTLQTAIDAASNGDLLQLSAGTYKGNINFNGKAITVQGLGLTSIIQGGGNIATVIFNSNEGSDSILDMVHLKGGSRAGALLIDSASPIIRRTWILKNKSIGAGSGIYIYGKDSNGDSATVTNCVLTYNKTVSAQFGYIAHSIYINDSDPTITNNTIIYNDRAAINITGSSNPTIKNNILGYNGRIKSKGKKKRGRGILIDYAQSSVGGDIQYNLFYKNKKGDFGFDSDVVKTYSDEKAIALLNGFGNFTLENNLQGNPLMTFSLKKNDKKKLLKTFDISLSSGSPAINAGDPDSSFNDTDATRNDIGATGGPTPIQIQ